MHTTRVKPARCVAIPAKLIGLLMVSCLSVRIVTTASMLISLVLVILLCARCLSGKTGQARVSCQDALMGRTLKPKQRVCKDTLSCGGVQTQTPGFSYGVPDNYSL